MQTPSNKPEKTTLFAITERDLGDMIDAAVTRAREIDNPRSVKNATLNAAAQSLAGKRTNWGGLKAKSLFVSSAARAAGATLEVDAGVVDTAQTTPAIRLPRAALFPEFGVVRSRLPGEDALRAAVQPAFQNGAEAVIFQATYQKWGELEVSGSPRFMMGAGDDATKTIEALPQESAGSFALAGSGGARIFSDAGISDWLIDSFTFREGWSVIDIAVTPVGILIWNPLEEIVSLRKDLGGNPLDVPVMPSAFRENFGPSPVYLGIDDSMRIQLGYPTDDLWFWGVDGEVTRTDLGVLRRVGLALLPPQIRKTLLRAMRDIGAGKGLDPKHAVQQGEYAL